MPKSLFKSGSEGFTVTVSSATFLKVQTNGVSATGKLNCPWGKRTPKQKT